jgi:resuscitation-promoting factor RpfA
MSRRFARPAVVIAADAVALVALRPSATLVHDLAAPHAWVNQAGADAAVAALAGAALWVAALWLAIGLLTAVAATAPWAVGRGADRILRAVLPHAVRRIVVGSAGLGVFLAPVVATAQDPVAAAGPATAVTAPSVTAPSATAPTVPPPAPPSVPAPSWPVAHQPASTPVPVGQVTVRAGDSLWSIAADHLKGAPDPNRVARAWPAWFAANRTVIGRDPAVIHPGQVLRIPTPTTAEEAS